MVINRFSGMDAMEKVALAQISCIFQASEEINKMKWDILVLVT